jgi:hypothetical protein
MRGVYWAFVASYILITEKEMDDAIISPTGHDSIAGEAGGVRTR